MILPLSNVLSPLGASRKAPSSQSYRDLIMSHSPILYLRVGESSGITAQDETANNYDGTYTPNSAGSFTGGTLGSAGAISGDADTAVTLNGSGGRIDFGDLAALELTGNFSIELWVYPTANGFYPGLFTKSSAFDEATAKYALYLEGSTRRPKWSYGGTVGVVFHSTALTLDAWSHVVLTSAGTGANNHKLYVNGSSQSGTQGSNPSYSTEKAVAGAFQDNGTASLTGRIDELAIYAVTLTPSQVSEHYDKGVGA